MQIQFCFTKRSTTVPFTRTKNLHKNTKQLKILSDVKGELLNNKDREFNSLGEKTRASI